jgi:hypothetical protein
LTVDECRVFQSRIEDGELGKLGKDGKHLRDWAMAIFTSVPYSGGKGEDRKSD